MTVLVLVSSLHLSLVVCTNAQLDLEYGDRNAAITNSIQLIKTFSKRQTPVSYENGAQLGFRYSFRNPE